MCPFTEASNQKAQASDADMALQQSEGCAGMAQSFQRLISACHNRVVPIVLQLGVDSHAPCPAPAASDYAARKPPPATTNPLDIVFVSAEVAPWSKTGGLGDVMGALPQAMAERGHRVMVVSPR